MQKERETKKTRKVWIIKAQPRCAPKLIVYFLQQTKHAMQPNGMASADRACKDGNHGARLKKPFYQLYSHIIGNNHLNIGAICPLRANIILLYYCIGGVPFATHHRYAVFSKNFF